ncbi:hypothetical protein ACFQHV_10965 [Promicromonospora thailandica]|uniref:Uncharacterized protein n=1 Tax=Promicromonospora thailandica TaxID=765201 RepID=A0A9X2G0V4_9MICO|nr:hypothetical protein [Promicromonospora thailandica]MCP2264997.1 hypothetical protein [Promicromonospora thailandica]BFF18718.1 hypothetical protein GCM10025730_22390 [Promicromonospora thailandica]
MLTYNQPQHTAEDAAEAMRNLVFATRTFADPCDTYWVVSDLAATARRMGQVATQVAAAHRQNLHLAHDHTGSTALGGVKALTAAAHLRRVADLLRQAHTSLDLAAKHSGAIAWYGTVPAPTGKKQFPACQDRRSEATGRQRG